MLEKGLIIGILCLFFWLVGSSKNVVWAANPYLPLWEHLPDAEPRLFADPDRLGRYRVYIYGSHDTRRTGYCGYDIPIWSAPIEDLTAWYYHGPGFQSIVNGAADVLFAPDVVEVAHSDGTMAYYLYPNNQAGGRNSQVAVANRPDGPFTVCNWKQGSTTQTVGVMGFDPAVFVDDDGRVYGYWGFKRLFAAELDPATMYSVKPGTTVMQDLIGSCDQLDGNIFRYFEAPSLRKVEGVYVLIYSRVTVGGEYGLGESNATLAYAYSPSPLGPWVYGGTVVDARGPEVGKDGRMMASQPSHNTHGSILEINGRWYVFYHRSINNHGYSRQAMVDPVQVQVSKDGQVTITGVRVIRDSLGNEYTGAEVTSQGFEIEGLDPYKYYSAGIASFLTGGAYVKATYDPNQDHAPVVNIGPNSIVGYKYFDFSLGDTQDRNLWLELTLIPMGPDFWIQIMMTSPWESLGGSELAVIQVPAGACKHETKMKVPVLPLDQIGGKQGLYLVFHSDQPQVCCKLVGLRFFRQ